MDRQTELERVSFDVIASPVGDLYLAVEAAGAVVRIAFLRHRDTEAVTEELRAAGWQPERDTASCADVARQLDDYFEGRRQEFDLPLAPQGSGFQTRVWRALRGIPFGKTVTYGELAARIGRDGGARAVGRANGENPIAIAIPCHRVIGADGRLTGYGGGLEAKTWLLRHEGAWAQQASLPLDETLPMMNR